MEKIVVLTGAGMSAESGLQTFRDSNGLWNDHDIHAVASPAGWKKDPRLVLDFYNTRRRELKTVKPNAAHDALAQLQEDYEVLIITQNVDDLHERAGSKQVIHLHGELLKVRSEKDPHLILRWEDDLNPGDVGPDGAQLRPHVVWFGEAVPLLNSAIEELRKADYLFIIGTSLQVYPAANLLHYCPSSCPIYYVDPNPAISSTDNIRIFREKATEGVPKLIQQITS